QLGDPVANPDPMAHHPYSHFTVPSNKALNLIGVGPAQTVGAGALQSVGISNSAAGGFTNVTWSGPIRFTGDTSVGGDPGSLLVLTGAINDAGTGPNPRPFKLTKIGANTLAIPTPNLLFTGPAEIDNGNLLMMDPLALGPATGGTITVLTGGSLSLAFPM